MELQKIISHLERSQREIAAYVHLQVLSAEDPQQKMLLEELEAQITEYADDLAALANEIPRRW